MNDKVIILKRDELNQIIAAAVEQGVNRALEKYGNISPLITRPEIIRQIGRSNYENAVRNGHFTPQKNTGKNAKVFIPRMQFDNYIMKSNL